MEVDGVVHVNVYRVNSTKEELGHNNPVYAWFIARSMLYEHVSP